MNENISAWKLEQAMSVLLQVKQRLLEENPEIIDDDKLYLDCIDGESGNALDTLDAVIRASVLAAGMAEEAATRAKAIAARAARFKARSETLRGAAFAALTALEVRRYERSDFTASIRTTPPSVLITDETALPKAFLRIRVEPDKLAIGAALKAGETVDGAVLTNGSKAIQIRTT